jgi:ribosomal protein S6--L-glutamate ligase
VDLSPVPEDALKLALLTARLCRWDDVGIDICVNDGKYYVLEGNMKYGREGFRAAGIDYQQLMSDLIEQGEI